VRGGDGAEDPGDALAAARTVRAEREPGEPDVLAMAEPLGALERRGEQNLVVAIHATKCARWDG
jgi:hypothetical protein